MARLMVGHVGEVFSGTVSGVSESGFYVSLSNGAEGLVSVRTLEDWFAFDERRMLLRGERTGAVISLGQAVTVRVTSVELSGSFINLELTGPLKPGKKTEKSEKKRERERMRAFSR